MSCKPRGEVLIDDRPNRNNTVTGWRLARWILWRAFIHSLTVSAVGVLVLPKVTISRVIGTFLIFQIGFFLVVTLYHALVVFIDYAEKKPLKRLYRCNVSPGVDQPQSRIIRIREARPDLDKEILFGLRAIPGGEDARQLSSDYFEGFRPRRRGRLPTITGVRVKRSESGEAELRVESWLAERGAWLMKHDRVRVDFGSCIEAVEEFQLALCRALTKDGGAKGKADGDRRDSRGPESLQSLPRIEREGESQ
jgi:hypothetical protein